MKKTRLPGTGVCLDNIKTDHKEWEGMHVLSSSGSGSGHVAGFCPHGNEASGSTDFTQEKY